MKEFIKGNYQRNIYAGENGFTIGIIRVKDTNIEQMKDYIGKTMTFTGYFAGLNIDDIYILYGEIVNHPKYGLQYQVTDYEKVKPDDRDGIVAFLCSDLFHGVGEKMATAIVDRLGDTALTQILEEPSCLELIPKLTHKKAKHIYETLVKYEESQKTIIYLTEQGFTMRDALLIYNEYHEKTIQVIENNIYKLLEDIEQLSFQKIDAVARGMEIALDDEHRMKACIIYIMQSICFTSGDVYLTLEQIQRKCDEYLNFELKREKYEVYTQELAMEQYIVIQDNKYYLKELYDAEDSIVKKIDRLQKNKIPVIKKFNELFSQLEKTSQITYGMGQKRAIKMALTNSISIITGGPGTGKTTIIKAIFDLYLQNKNLKMDDALDVVALLAPTGRASKRMSESTLFGATTIHRFLRWNKDLNQFGINEYNKSTCKLVIIDEFSMIDVLLLSNLFKGLGNDVQIVIVGDYNQLPSVGPGQVLKDLIESDTIPMISLDVLYRQSEDSYITMLAHDIQNNLVDENIVKTTDDYAFLACSNESIAKNISILANQIHEKGYTYKQVQFMAPMYAGINGIDSLNKILQNIFNPADSNKREVKYGDVIFRENDKVLQLVNMPEENIFNGDIGIISYIIPAINSKSKKNEIYVDFDGNIVKFEPKDLNKIKHGFIISIHKAQGSEFDIVVLPLCMSYFRMLYRKLIYTGITRAKKKLILIGEPRAFEYAIKNETEYIRKTTLCCKLKNQMNNFEQMK